MNLVAQVIDLHKDYHLAQMAVPALRGVSLDIPEGDFIAIMGASGAGKSTLLNLLGCLDRPSSGRYLLCGQDVAELSDDELAEIRSVSIGFVFQSYQLLPQLTVLENLEVPLYYRGNAPADARQHCLALAEAVGLSDRLSHRPNELSGGQQQRLAIARALVNDPELVLADDPTGNLDTRTSDEILNLLVSLNEMGKTIVMVTHENDIAARAKRIVRLRDGQLIDDCVRVAVSFELAATVEEDR